MGRAGSKSRGAAPNRGSLVITTLESAWASLRSIERQIPPAVLTLVDARSRRQLRGYFADSAWRKAGRGGAHEISVNPQLLQQPEELLATLLHEAAHAVLHETGKNAGVGSTHYYHTKAFRDLCRDYGLECRFRNTRYGWTDTAWPRRGAVPNRWSPVLKILKTLPSGTGTMELRRAPLRPLPTSGRVRLVCNCQDKRRVLYVPKSVATSGGVVCSHCQTPFRPGP